MGSGAVGGLAAAILVPFIFYLLSRVRGLRIELPPDFDYETLTKKYSKWEGISALLILFFAALFGFLFYALLRGLAAVAASRLPQDAVYTLTPPAIFWAVPALFLGLFAAGFPTYLITRHLLGPEAHAEYMLWGNSKAASRNGRVTPTHALDSWKVFKGMAAFCLCFLAVLIPLALDSYTVITRSGIVLNPLFSFVERRFAWSDVQEIKRVVSFVAPSGKPVHNPYAEVRFRDGSVWSTRFSFATVPKDKAEEIFHFISERSGKTIVTEDPYPDARQVD